MSDCLARTMLAPFSMAPDWNYHPQPEKLAPPDNARWRWQSLPERASDFIAHAPQRPLSPKKAHVFSSRKPSVPPRPISLPERLIAPSVPSSEALEETGKKTSQRAPVPIPFLPPHKRCAKCRTSSQTIGGTRFRTESSKTETWWNCHLCQRPYSLNRTEVCWNPACGALDAATTEHQCIHDDCGICVPKQSSPGTRNIYHISKTPHEEDTNLGAKASSKLGGTGLRLSTSTDSEPDPPDYCLDNKVARDRTFSEPLETWTSSGEGLEAPNDNSDVQLADTHRNSHNNLRNYPTERKNKDKSIATPLESAGEGPKSGNITIETASHSDPIIPDGGKGYAHSQDKTSTPRTASASVNEALTGPNEFSGVLKERPRPRNRIDQNSRPSSRTGTYFCIDCDAWFFHRKDYHRHQATIHRSPRQYLCLEASCKRSKPDSGFSRRDNLRNHMKAVHGKALEQTSKYQFSQKSYTPRESPAERNSKSSKGDFPTLIYKGDTMVGKSSLLESLAGTKGLKSLHHLSYFLSDGDFEALQNDTKPIEPTLTDFQRSPEPRYRELLPYLDHGPSDPSFNRTDMFRRHEKFREKASRAFKKLQSAAPQKSAVFQAFVASLGDLDEVIDVGYSTLGEYIDENKKKLPEDLKSLYCMLHICYAMSQTASAAAFPTTTDEEFGKSATEWKGCLPEISESGVHEQDLFDELVSVMWVELKEGWEFMENSDWEKILGPEFSNFDPTFSPVYDFDTGDPLFSLSDFVSVDMLSWDNQSSLKSPGSGSSPPEQNSNCSESTLSAITANSTPMPHDLDSFSPQNSSWSKPVQHPWETLFGTLVITVALRFIQEFQETSSIFRYLCSKISCSTLDIDQERPQSQRQPVSDLDTSQRQDIMNFLQDSLSQRLSPILNAVSDHFLSGIIKTLHDLEECMVAFLMICCVNTHTFLCFFSDIISRFYSYYHTRLPPNLKTSNDAYNSPNYVSDRRREEERSLAISCPEPGPKNGKHKLLNEPDAEGSQSPELSNAKKPRLEEGIATLGDNKVEYKWKNITGQPRKRKNILKNLPRAANPANAQ
ncbi:hypothetical protein TWF281_002392 [Arthrobotrys megalospora]